MSNGVAVVPSSAIVSELLNNDNYIKWSSVIKSYLIAQDLWDVVEPNNVQPPQNFSPKRVENVRSEPPKPEASTADKDHAKSSALKPEDGLNREGPPEDASHVDQLPPKQGDHDHLDDLPKSQDVDQLPPKQGDHDHLDDLPKSQDSGLIDQSPKPDQDQGNHSDDARKLEDGVSDDHDGKSPKKMEDHGKHDDQPSNHFDPIKFKEQMKAKRRREAAALHAIKISCGSEALSVIIHVETDAKLAWNILEMKFKPQLLRKLPDSPNQPSNEVPVEYEDLYKTIVRGDWGAAKSFLEKHPEAATVVINPFRETPLHVAALYGHTRIVEELLKLEQMTSEHLEIRQNQGYTALSLAAMIGIVPMAKCLIERNPKLAGIASYCNALPALLAITVGHFDMARYLYPLTKLDDLTKNDCANGTTLLAQCILSKNFDIALDLITRYPKLTIAKSMFAVPSPIILAMSTFAFPSGSPLAFWQKWIYDCINIPPNSAALRKDVTKIKSTAESDSAACEDTHINISGESYKDPINGPREKNTTTVSDPLRGIGSHLFEFLGIKKIHELKLVHAQSREFLCCTLDNLRTLMSENRPLVTQIAYQAMHRAVEEGNVEFIIEVSKAIPELIRYLDHRLRSIFSYAVECRQAEIFNLVHGFVILKEEMAALVDDAGNTVLHMAGKLASPSHLSHIPGAALQMQRELQWFKEVESIMQNKLVQKEFYRNGKNMTPREYFTENHKELMKEGEKWMKETATNCTFVSALIVTIMFAAAFIVPGGTEGEKNLEVISHQKWFLLYIISDAISLFSSTTSVLMFLGILTSRYYEDAFLISLPTKLIIGLSTLFFSIATMMIAFCSALYVMLQGQLTILIPVILLASVPVSLFVKLQFPILVEIFMSTYGKGIFARKNDNWLFQ